jgi:hypothetical protein
MDICLSCFSSGRENEWHKNDHPYRVVNLQRIRTFHKWNAFEELELSEKFSLNPSLISKLSMSENDSKRQEIDLEGFSIGRFNQDECIRHLENWFRLFQNNAANQTDELKLYKSRFRLTMVPFKEAFSNEASNYLSTIRPAPNSKLYRLMNGYRPSRGDFETEHNDKFEQNHIANMLDEQDLNEMLFDDSDELEDNDYFIECKLKTSVLHIYNRLIQERWERNQFVKNFGLLNEVLQQDYKSTIAHPKTSSNPLRPLLKSFDPKVESSTLNLQKINVDSLHNWTLPIKFHRLFANYDDYLKCAELLNHYGLLKKRLDDLREYRSNGIRSLKHVGIYKNYKLKRINRVATVYMASLLTSMNRFDVKSINSEPALQMAKQQCYEWFRKLVVSEKSLTPKTSSSDNSTLNATSAANPVAAAGTTATATTSNTSPSIPMSYPATQMKHKHNPLKIENFPDSDKLDEDEKEFCRVSRIQPSVYLRVKAILVLENKKAGYCTYSRARKLACIDVNRTRLIHNLMIKLDLINPNPTTD